MPSDGKSIRRAVSRVGASSALDRSLSLDGNHSLTFSRHQSRLQRVVSIRDDAKEAAKLTADVVAWCKATSELKAVLGSGTVTAAPLSGGLCNDVWRVQGPDGTILVKRAQGFVRAAAEVELAIERQATEAAGLEIGHACAPDSIPRFLFHDSREHLLAVEFLEGRCSLSEALQRGQIFPQMAQQLGTCLGRLAAGTTPEALGIEGTEKLAATLAASVSAAACMEKYVFYLPFDASEPGNDWPDILDDEVLRLVHNDRKFNAELATLRRIYKNPGSAKCLTHHDCWSGNILCTSTTTHIIDFEFGGWGPAAYDIGHAIAHFVLAATVVRAYADIEAAEDDSDMATNDVHDNKNKDVVSAARRNEQEEWLLNSIGAAYDAFATSLEMASKGTGVPTAPLEDVIGFAGVVALRWTIGQFNLPENLGIERNSPVFVDATRRAVRVGAAMVKGRRSLSSINKVAELLRAELQSDGSGSGEKNGACCAMM